MTFVSMRRQATSKTLIYNVFQVWLRLPPLGLRSNMEVVKKLKGALQMQVHRNSAGHLFITLLPLSLPNLFAVTESVEDR
jgi:hypothetical protein